MIFFDKTRTIGQDANGKNVVWVSIYVDTAANLPAYNDYQSDGFIMCMASEGRCIDTGDLYRLDSSGVWQISQAGTGTYTKAEIDALLNAKQGVLTFDATPTQNSTNPVTSGGIWADQQRQDELQSEDRSALVELVDGGAKNLLENSASSTGIATVNSDGTVTINGSQSTDLSLTLSDTLVLDAGTYIISAGTIMQSKTYLTIVIVSGGTQYSIFASNPNGYLSFTLNEKTNIPRVYIWVDKNKTINNLTIKPMICTKAAWEISQAYQPYRPSWQEMYGMILALQ